MKSKATEHLQCVFRRGSARGQLSEGQEQVFHFNWKGHLLPAYSCKLFAVSYTGPDQEINTYHWNVLDSTVLKQPVRVGGK